MTPQPSSLGAGAWALPREPGPTRSVARATRRKMGRNAAPPSPEGEIPERAPQAFLGGVLEGERVKIGQMAGRSVVRPAEADLDAAGPQCHELLDWPGIVGHRDSRTKPAGCPILVTPYPTIRCGDANQARGFIVGDNQRAELAFALVIALTRNGSGGDWRCDERGEGRQDQTGRGHFARDGSDVKP